VSASIIGGLAWVSVGVFLFFQVPDWGFVALVLSAAGGYFVVRGYRIAAAR
jgi:hypothetical protein